MLNTRIAPWPYFDEEQVQAVSSILRSGKINNWTSDEVRNFESEYASYLGVKHAIALGNGTLALELPLIALGIGPGDEVIVTPRTFVASASVACLRGAKAVFVDLDPKNGNISAETIAAAVTPATKAIICVHLGGIPCDMDPIMQLAMAHRIAVIEDCAQAHGAKYKGKNVGSIGHFGAFSFCQDKIISTGGEGGLVATNDTSAWEHMWSYKDHGKNYSKMNEPSSSGQFRFVHDSVGNNYRLTAMQAALGRIQLARLDSWIQRRREIGQRLQNAVQKSKFLTALPAPTYAYEANYRQYFFANKEAAGLRPLDEFRDSLIAKMRIFGAPVFAGSGCEVNREACFNAQNSRVVGSLAVARQFAQSSIAFLTHPNMTEADILFYERAIAELG